MSNIGFKDTRYARLLNPPLTTVRLAMDRKSEVTRILLAIVADDVELQWVTLRHELITRGAMGTAGRRQGRHDQRLGWENGCMS